MCQQQKQQPYHFCQEWLKAENIIQYVNIVISMLYYNWNIKTFLQLYLLQESSNKPRKKNIPLHWGEQFDPRRVSVGFLDYTNMTADTITIMIL